MNALNQTNSTLSFAQPAMDQTTLMIIIISVIVATLGALALLLTKSKGSKKRYVVNNNTILITGEMNSGKTALFYFLKTGKLLPSVTSLQQNKGTFVVKQFEKVIPASKNWSYYDLPGHGSFKSQLPHIIPSTKAIVFMVDSTSLSSIATAAQSLYTFMTNKYISDYNIPIIITVNKIDEEKFTLPLSQIKKLLAAEINQIYKANLNAKRLDSIGAGVDSDDVMTPIPLLKGNAKEFNFDQTDAINVKLQWACVSVKNGDIEQLTQALAI